MAAGGWGWVQVGTAEQEWVRLGRSGFAWAGLGRGEQREPNDFYCIPRTFQFVYLYAGDTELNPHTLYQCAPCTFIQEIRSSTRARIRGGSARQATEGGTGVRSGEAGRSGVERGVSGE